MRITMDSFSIQGKRNEQQDHCNYLIENEQGMAVVCDGVGGLRGGALASKYASNRFQMDYRIWKELGGSLSRFLEEEGIRLDEGVFQLKDEDGGRLKAGTTIASMVYVKNEMYWLSIGDSKIFVYREGRLKCITREHNYGLLLKDMLKNHGITQEEYEAKQSMSEGLISYLGMGNVRIMDVNQRPFKMLSGDVIILCTDGVHRVLSEEIITGFINENANAPEGIVNAMQKALMEIDSEGQDNATAIVIAVDL